MEQNILISKIASSSTITGWSQSYSTHYLYFVVSVKTELEDLEVASIGKELLEKLQREFFALPEKKLTPIKSAVEASLSVLPAEVTYSIVVATIISDVLYIVIASHGQVVIKREKNYHIIAKGTPEQVSGFSGKLKHSDIIILETSDFATKIGLDIIEKIPNVSGVLDLSENIAPLIHEETLGTEAAIFLQYQHFTPHTPINNADDHANVTPVTQSSRLKIPQYEPETPENEEPKEKKRFPTFKIPSIPRIKFSKKVILTLLIILLVGGLSFAISQDQKRKDQKQENQALLEVLTPARKKYTEGVELLSLNESLALDDIRAAEKMLLDRKSQFPEGSDARADYDGLLAEIQGKINEFEKGSTVSPIVVFDSKNSKDLAGVNAVTVKGGNLIIADSALKLALLKDDGSIENVYTTNAKKLTGVTANENVILALSPDGIYQIDKKGSSGKKVINETSINSIDVFGTNVYGGQSSTINKYGGEGFSKSSYFQGTPSFKNPISDFAIDGNVWVIETDGTLHKFLRGKEESFTIKNTPTKIGKNPKLYTGEDVKSVYILDPTNKKIVVIDKEGAYKSSYSLSLSHMTDFAVNETQGKVYIVSNNKLYSFDL